MKILIKSYWELTAKDKAELQKFESIKLSRFQRIINFIARLPNRFFIKIYLQCLDKEIIGICVTSFNSIIGLNIKKEYQRKGYGTKLLNFVLNDLQNKFNIIKLRPFNNSESFYKKFGFQKYKIYRRQNTYFKRYC